MMRLIRLVLATALAGGLFALGAPAALGTTDAAEGLVFHPFTMDSGNSTCVPWTDGAETTRNCDPVNLLFKGKTWQQARDALVAKGWTTRGSGSNQRLHFASSTLVVQNVQLFRSDGFSKRYHIRLWQTGSPASTLGAVHHERGTFNHVIDIAWESVEAFVRGQLCSGAAPAFACTTSASLTSQLAIQALDPDGNPTTWRGWANNGSLTVITG